MTGMDKPTREELIEEAAGLHDEAGCTLATAAT